MSKRRREWKESLKQRNDDLDKKKKKIEILEEKTYKVVNGQMVLVDSTKSRNSKSNTENSYNNNNIITNFKNKNQMSPSQLHKKVSVSNLTPTYRNPNRFLTETKKVMSNISATSEEQDQDSTEKKHIYEELNETASSSSYLHLSASPKKCVDGDKWVITKTEGLTVTNDQDQQNSNSISLNTIDNTPENHSYEKNNSFNAEVSRENDSRDSDGDKLNGHTSTKNSRRQLIFLNNAKDDSLLKDGTESNVSESSIVEETSLKDIHDNCSLVQLTDMDLITDLDTENEMTLSTFEQAGASLMAKTITNSCGTSFEVTIQAEVYSEPVPRKHKENDENTCNKITVQPDKLDEITVLTNEDIISIGVVAEQCTKSNKKESREINLRNRSGLRKKNMTVLCDKSYLDFMTEEDRDQLLLDEAFPSEASDQENYSEEVSDSESTTDEQETRLKKKNKKSKKTKPKVQCSSQNDHDISAFKKKSKAALQKENLSNKNKGDCYVNSKGENVEAKFMKPNPCIGKQCGNDCGSISEEKRQTLFSYFMGLNCHQRRKDWIAQCAIKSYIKRSRTKNSPTRHNSYQYFINEEEGRRRVCQKFLINTLDITQRFILYTLDTMVGGFAKTDQRGNNGGYNKTKEAVRDYAQKFIESLPKLPSHYCRGESKRLYFPAEFKNITNLHRIYRNNCQQSNVKAMSFQVFRNWFHELFNIGFHIPKKDKCTLCAKKENEKDTHDEQETEKEKDVNKEADSLKNKNDLKAEKEKEKLMKHIQEKDASYNRFKYHQNINKTDKSTICASFDMQKVLNTPHGESMNLYYSRKLAIYNFTIYESSTRKAYCKVWSEADAKRGADEISSCLYEYIKDVDARGYVKTLLLYCDSCYGQNKNKTVLSMIRYALSKCENLTTIQINYLIPGHTYMPVDSVHATIEKKIKKTIVWAPSQWPTIMEVSRQDPEPYIVSVLNGKDFIGFSDVLESTFDKNHKIAVSKLNTATFKKEKPDVISIKQSMLPDAEARDVLLLPLTDCMRPKENLYPTSLGISSAKHKDLRKLVDKGIIPARFASEYKTFKINTKVKDQLVETDEEDTIDDAGDE